MRSWRSSETLLTRLPAVSSTKGVPEELREVIATLIFASNYCTIDLPELEKLKRQFGRKYGKGYVVACEGEGTGEACGVNSAIAKYLKVKIVDQETVRMRLESIAPKNEISVGVPEMPERIEEEELPAPATESASAESMSYTTAAEAAAAAEAAETSARSV